MGISSIWDGSYLTLVAEYGNVDSICLSWTYQETGKYDPVTSDDNLGLWRHYAVPSGCQDAPPKAVSTYGARLGISYMGPQNEQNLLQIKGSGRIVYEEDWIYILHLISFIPHFSVDITRLECYLAVLKII